MDNVLNISDTLHKHVTFHLFRFPFTVGHYTGRNKFLLPKLYPLLLTTTAKEEEGEDKLHVVLILSYVQTVSLFCKMYGCSPPPTPPHTHYSIQFNSFHSTHHFNHFLPFALTSRQPQLQRSNLLEYSWDTWLYF